MKNLQRNRFWDKIIWYIAIVVLNDPEEKKYKRTMMVLYRSPEQTALHTYCWSFSKVHCSKIFV